MEKEEYIYKLVDEERRNDLEKFRVISLSRPFFEFKWEGKDFKVFRKIQEYYGKISNDELKGKILPNIEELKKIYVESLPNEKRQYYKDEMNIRSDLRIITCIYFQTYCGYFTSENLIDRSIRNMFIMHNNGLSHTGNPKSHAIAIPIKTNDLDIRKWVCKNLTANQIFYPENNNEGGIIGNLYRHEAEYMNDLSAKAGYRRFNDKSGREMSSFFIYFGEKQANLKEQRLLFRLYDYKPNSSVVAADDLFSTETIKSIDEQIFYDCLSTYLYAQQFPEYIYLHVNEFSCEKI